MKQAVTIARKHGEDTFHVLVGPELPYGEHTKLFKELVNKQGDGLAEAQIISSVNGRERRKKWSAPEPAEPAEATEPKGDEPKGDEPKGDEPKGDEPKGDEPKGDEPKGDAKPVTPELPKQPTKPAVALPGGKSQSPATKPSKPKS